MRQYEDQLQKLNSRMDDERAEQGDRVKAKLAAKKRMREELEKEKAVNKELDSITKSQVGGLKGPVHDLGQCLFTKISSYSYRINLQKVILTHTNHFE